MMETRRLTSWRRSFGVREQDNTALALLYQLCECCLLSIVCLDLSTEVVEINCAANLRCTSRGGSSSSWLGLAVGRVGNNALRNLDGVGHSFRDGGCSFRDGLSGLLDDRLLARNLFSLRRRCFLGWAHRRWGRRLAFA